MIDLHLSGLPTAGAALVFSSQPAVPSLTDQPNPAFAISLGSAQVYEGHLKQLDLKRPTAALGQDGR